MYKIYDDKDFFIGECYKYEGIEEVIKNEDIDYCFIVHDNIRSIFYKNNFMNLNRKM